MPTVRGRGRRPGGQRVDVRLVGTGQQQPRAAVRARRRTSRVFENATLRRAAPSTCATVVVERRQKSRAAGTDGERNDEPTADGRALGRTEA